MRAIATEGVAWSVCLCVCLLVAFIGPAKMAEPIEMPFGADSHGSKEPCIREGSRSDESIRIREGR